MKPNTFRPLRVREQFVRYAVIGVLLNATLYAAYLFLTWSMLGSRAAMTVTYAAGVLIGYMLNRNITFNFRGDKSAALARYVASYGIGYAIDFIGLWLFVDLVGFRHEGAQAFLTLAIALVLFALQRYWVFAPSPTIQGEVTGGALRP